MLSLVGIPKLLIVRVVVSIPFFLLWKVHISPRQKLALSGIFSLVIFTIIFAIVRATITTVHANEQMDPIWMYLWTVIELNVGKALFPLIIASA